MLDKWPKPSFSNVFCITYLRSKLMLNMMWFRFCVVWCISFAFGRIRIIEHAAFQTPQYLIIRVTIWLFQKLFESGNYSDSGCQGWASDHFILKGLTFDRRNNYSRNQFWTRDIFNWFISIVCPNISLVWEFFQLCF